MSEVNYGDLKDVPYTEELCEESYNVPAMLEVGHHTLLSQLHHLSVNVLNDESYAQS